VSAFGAAFRLARRGTTLSVRHAVLILLVIALPIAGLSAFVLRAESQLPSAAELATNELGHTASELVVLRSPDPTARQDGLDLYNLQGDSDDQGTLLHPDTGKLVDPRTVLPAGTRVLTISDSTARVEAGPAQITVPVTLGPTADRSLRGKFDLVAGRAPRSALEITANQAALDRLGVGVGGQVRVTDPVTMSYTVVGVLADRRNPSSTPRLFLPSGSYNGTTAAPTLRDERFFLPALDLSWSHAQRLNHQGTVVWSRALLERFGAPSNQWDQNVGVYLMEYGFLGALGAFIIALLAGSAFGIGARARQRALAVIAATGASRRLIFALMVGTGGLVGALAGLVGVGLGAAVGAGWMALTDDGTLRHYAGFHFDVRAQLAVFLYAILVGVIAAAVPAVSVSRVDTVAALRGARRPAPQSRRRPIVGVVMVLGGAALSIVAGAAGAYFGSLGSGSMSYGPGSGQSWAEQHAVRLGQASGYGLAAGIIVTQLGLLLCASLVVRWTGQLLGRAGIAARLAGRDLARNRARTVPTIGAIMATSFLAVFAAALLVSQDATNTASYRYALQPGQIFVPSSFENGATLAPAATRAAIVDNVPVSSIRTITGAALPPDRVSASPSQSNALYAELVVPAAQRCPVGADGQQLIAYNAPDPRCRDDIANGVTHSSIVPLIVIGDADDLAELEGRTPSPAARAALAHGGAVALHAQFVSDGTITVGWVTSQDFGGFDSRASTPSHVTPIAAVAEGPTHSIVVGAVLSPQAAARAGIDPLTMGTLAQTKDRPTDAQFDAVDGAIQRLSGSNQAAAQYEVGPQNGQEPFLVWAALGGASFLALCAAAVALALARSDGRRDVEVLDAVGAPPGIRRRYAVWQSVMITGIGMLLGAITGTIGAFAIEGTSRTDIFVMPWGAVALAVVGTTVVIAGISWLTAGKPRGPSLRAAIA
jgi:hypothetical protein